ncbi:23S rRNA (uracil(1939)-C(5))-methyltransferase RlmD [Cognatilysobacter lacus]|uniref:23S rRNA (uracil(1939)-C(5))-methyltransferase RlmD n=1 Tax=Cognatilysobacter lacus TaxID=1643323 RepID=A0A5D8Z0I9_9GAMM|nr:23S rRNA (uracil(1939)-C(5))-methyltransferase RlmD [Lysobacter lacus]TZF88187.1 23S rRNA (uracil(1939)-C(5))-methyltransferase RlmD [Lysobacter lacus]
MARLDQTPFPADITGLTHDGRGVARLPDGKAIFIAGALPDEKVVAVRTARHRSFDEAKTVEVVEASSERVEPRCPHFGTCAGCALQHFDEAKQIIAKQRVLQENLERIGHVTPKSVLEPLVDAAWGYRRKGRLSVRRVDKKGRTLVGFRESDPRFVADISECHTVIPAIGQKIGAISALVDSLDGRRDIPQIEFIAGDEAVVLTFRHVMPLTPGDRDRLAAFGADHGFAIYLQPGGIESVHPLGDDEPKLAFRLPAWDVELKFRPLDFIQVNAGLNQHMIRRTIELLDPQRDERVLDLFAGLGNFTLPLSRYAREVVGVEGEAGLVQRARENVTHNAITNVEFHAADLAKDLSREPWMRESFDKLLLDPPRSGADFVLAHLPLKQFKRIVYVSCHPASLARDAAFLVNEKGWVLKSAGVMDMFPHTAHVESIAVFEPR